MTIAEHYDVIVIGSGAGGLSVALGVDGAARVAVVTRGVMGLDGSSCWAQGGIAAAVGPGDSTAQHAADTITVGARLNSKAAARWLAEAAPDVIRWLISVGVQFDTVRGRLALGLEAGHSFPRILHAGGDATGVELMRALREACSLQPNIDCLEFSEALEILKQAGRAAGVLVRTRTGSVVRLYAPRVVIASGGIGQLYRYTSNPVEADGSGIALAHRAGAELADLEFVQFHPTAMAPQDNEQAGQLPLVTEALRGAGATLISEGGTRFMVGVHPQGELAPRDVVARAVWGEMSRGQAVYLDARPLGDSVRTRFPNFFQACLGRGTDPRVTPIRVVPAAHYHMGGIRVDLHSMSTLPGLYAVGEAACTGVHGANRLASNSLLEAVAFGRALGERLARTPAGPVNPGAIAEPTCSGMRAASANDALILARMRQLMWSECGIARSEDGLQTALQQIQVLERRCLPGAPALRQLLVARLVVEAAIRRKQGVGAHNVVAAKPLPAGSGRAVA
jgi:L-aspartate oxidase